MWRTQSRDAAALAEADVESLRDLPAMVVSADSSTCTFARRLLGAGRPHEAIRILKRSPETERNTAEYQLVFSRAAFRAGDVRAAHRAYARAIELSLREPQS